MRTSIERAKRALCGIAIGDSAGNLIMNGLDPTSAPAPWRWSDDTAMASVIVAELCERGRIDADALACRFAANHAADPLRGYGSVAAHVLRMVHRGVPWEPVARAPFNGTGSLGNGGAMRSAPIGAFAADAVEAVVRMADDASKVTHWHEDGRGGGVAVAVAAAGAVQKQDRSALIELVLAHTPECATRRGIVAMKNLHASTPAEAARALGVGQRIHSADTVPFALWCASNNLGDFSGAIAEAIVGCSISADADTDTVLAIVGGIVACTDDRTLMWQDNVEALALGDMKGSGTEG